MMNFKPVEAVVNFVSTVDRELKVEVTQLTSQQRRLLPIQH